MKKCVFSAMALAVAVPALAASYYPTYFKMVVTDNVGHGGTCQISRLSIFNEGGKDAAENAGYLSLNLNEEKAGLAATALEVAV